MPTELERIFIANHPYPLNAGCHEYAVSSGKVSVMEFVPGVHKIPGVLWSCVYLIEGRDSLTLVDSGTPGSGRNVNRYLRSIGRDAADIEYILMTHSHPDHTAAAFGIAKRTGAKIVAHPLDSKVHSNGEVSLSYMGVFTSVRLPIPFLRFTAVAQLVDDGDVLPIGDGMRVLHTPGHTPGSLCYLDESRSLIFTGDTLFSDGNRISRSVPFPGSSFDRYRESVHRLADIPIETLCGGHGSPMVGGASLALRELLRTRPDPPTWGAFLKRIPKRIWRTRNLQGEHE